VSAVSWWLWVLIWVALALGALGFLFLLFRQLWRKLKLLFAELSTATERLSAVAEELERLDQQRSTDAEPAAVFEDPAQLRAQRFASRTKRRRPARRTRT
jgi:uncharacterized protein HemX